jgi:putative CRISPR-associated protein (TIGR02619 family)
LAVINSRRATEKKPIKRITMVKPTILICTVGTSLFRPNLENLQRELEQGSVQEDRKQLARAYVEKNDPIIARELGRLPANDRICGAEVNSIASMIEKGYINEKCGLYFMHSDTDDGFRIASILKAYYERQGHQPVKTVSVEDLQDQDAKRFRTKGLRNLARRICGVVRDHTPAVCAINATGGYKAQIAVAVLLGQAIGVPVFYKHELFPEIIAFPPMPVALDFELWMKASGMLFDLERSLEPARAKIYEEDWDEKYESLIERVVIDEEDFLELSPTGQIFHETFKEKFRTNRDQVLPPPVPFVQKRKPRVEDAGWAGEHPEVHQFLEKVTDQPWVLHCSTFYFNPDLPCRTMFRLGAKGIEGVFSNGSYCVKFRIETSAKTEGQQAAVVAALNQWLDTL